MHHVLLGGREIGEDSPCYVIAEAGSNHDRDVDQALRLIDVAADAGADAVKFQVFQADAIAADMTSPVTSLKGNRFGAYGDTLHELYRRLELPREWLPRLRARAEERSIEFCATPFDEDAVDELERTGVSFYKIASFELVHLPLIQYAARTGKPLVLSTGMADMAEIREAVEAAEEAGNGQLCLLHCGIEYPLAFTDVNLNAMRTMSESFPYPIGYSDHTPGISVPIAAAALGAKVIEKHFTLDRNLPGPDHRFALEPDELTAMVRGIREAEASLGDGVKAPTSAEGVYLERGRRSLFARRAIHKGERLAREDIAVLRPGLGLAPKYLDQVTGAVALTDLEHNEPLTWDKLGRSDE